LTIPQTNTYMIYWNKFPNGYGQSIPFDIYDEIIKYEMKQQNIRQCYKNNTHKKLSFIGNL